jgi:hypothetical protein
MKFNGIFIGGNNISETVNWVGGDFKEQYLEKVKTQPNDWYYKDRTITYSFNKHGHRSKDIEDIDLSNYILVLGCSHTLGVGLELEKTFPYLVAERLNCDYYNFGISASGIDVLEYNLLTWLKKVNKKPKAIVIQWPDHTRFASYFPGHENLVEKGAWTEETDSMEFIVNSEEAGFFNARKLLTLKLIKNLIDCPIVTGIFTSQPVFDPYNLYFKKIDKARDLGHAGIESHKNWAEVILKEFA